MNAPLAATLICLLCHTASLAASEAAVSLPPAQPVAMLKTTVADDPAPAAALRAAPSRDRPVMYARAAVHQPAQPAKQPAADDSDNTLLMVGLALMAGIAVRRWGAAG